MDDHHNLAAAKPPHVTEDLDGIAEIVSDDSVTALAKKMMAAAYDFDSAWNDVPDQRKRALLYSEAAHTHFAATAYAGGLILSAEEVADLRTVLWGGAGVDCARDRLRTLAPAIEDVDADTAPCQHSWTNTDLSFTMADGEVRGPFDGQQCTTCPAVSYGGTVLDPEVPQPKSCNGGRPFDWSAFGARYPDTTCIGGICADLDLDHSTNAGIPCPFCNPARFFEHQSEGTSVEPTCGTCRRRGLDPAALTFHDGRPLRYSVFCPTCASDQPAEMRDYPSADAAEDMANIALM